MALDAVTLSLISGELNEKLAGARIDKIFMPSKEEALFSLRTRNETFKLFVCLRSGGARIGLSEEMYENPDVPPSFCMLLRKHLSGGRILAVEAVHGERIVNLSVSATNELGDGRTLIVAAELMGRYANLVVYEMDGKVLDALKRIDFEDSEQRQLLPGLLYTLPPKPDRQFFLDASPAEVASKVINSEDLQRGIMSTVGGIGPVVAREIIHRTGCTLKGDAPTSEAVETSIKSVQEEAISGNPPVMVKNDKGEPCEFCFFTPSQFPSDYTLTPYNSYSSLLSDYYSRREQQIRLTQKSGNLSRQVKQLLERSVRKLEARRDELSKSEKSEQSRLYGELLSANMHLYKKGDNLVELLNYYSGENVKIKLDPRLTPAANSQKYYTDYKKKQTAVKMLTSLIREGELEIQYLKTVQYETERASSEAELTEIRAELKEAGYLKNFKQRNKKQKPADFLRFTSCDGFSILVGRNNMQNEKLSVKTARGKDYWFHVKNAPGSHVVVMSEGKDIPNTTLNDAAALAVHFSSQAGGNKVPVDHTMVKNLKKTSDLPLGMVIYDVYETAYVTPDKEQMQRFNLL